MKQKLAMVKVTVRSNVDDTRSLRAVYEVKNWEPSIIAHISAAKMIPNGRSES